jgi:DNA-binding transcriptional ArsR family regulator
MTSFPSNGRDQSGYRTGARKPGKAPRKLVTLDEAFRSLLGKRYEVLSVVALFGPLTATEICRKLDLRKSVISRTLGDLLSAELVEWMPLKTFRLFRLTNRVAAFKWNSKIQFCLQCIDGDWLFVHREEYSMHGRRIRPPQFFLDPDSKMVSLLQPIVHSETTVPHEGWTSSAKPPVRHGRSDEHAQVRVDKKRKSPSRQARSRSKR